MSMTLAARLIGLLLGAFALITLPAWALAADLQGKVVKISDGDTITILDADQKQYKVRLAGIDAPEKSQAFGQKSKENLATLVFGRQVTAFCGKQDKYQREVCKVIVDGLDANLEQVKAGLAWWYRKYAREQSENDRSMYEVAESDARMGKKGLWQDAGAIPPWEWRHSSKNKPADPTFQEK